MRTLIINTLYIPHDNIDYISIEDKSTTTVDDSYYPNPLIIDKIEKYEVYLKTKSSHRHVISTHETMEEAKAAFYDIVTDDLR